MQPLTNAPSNTPLTVKWFRGQHHDRMSFDNVTLLIGNKVRIIASYFGSLIVSVNEGMTLAIDSDTAACILV